MKRRFVAVLAFVALAAGPAALAQEPDSEKIEGLPTVGIENPKDEFPEVLLRLGFTFARADIPETVRHRLDAIAAVLTNERASARVEVSGHTDALGDEAYNQHLSEQRATSVKGYLVQQGVEASRISVVGYGEARPRAGNDTVEGRRLNRRVEVKVAG